MNECRSLNLFERLEQPLCREYVRFYIMGKIITPALSYTGLRGEVKNTFGAVELAGEIESV